MSPPATPTNESIVLVYTVAGMPGPAAPWRLGNGGVAALAGLTGAANKFAYFTGAEAMAVTDLTSFGRSVVGCADGAALRALAGLTGLLDLKGSTDCSANPNYPAAVKGDSYYVTVAGKIGGGSGKAVDVGDVYVASADNAGGTEGSVGTSWFVLEHNLSGVALLASPTFTGTPAAPTAAPGTNTTQLATTEFVGAAIGSSSPIFRASADLTGQTGANASVCTYTAPADGTYRVGVFLVLTAVTLDVLQVRVSYTDETNTARTQTFFPLGLTSADVASVGAYCFPTADVRVKSGTAVTVLTALTTGTGSIAYDVSGTVEQLR